MRFMAGEAPMTTRPILGTSCHDEICKLQADYHLQQLLWYSKCSMTAPDLHWKRLPMTEIRTPTARTDRWLPTADRCSTNTFYHQMYLQTISLMNDKAPYRR